MHGSGFEWKTSANFDVQPNSAEYFTDQNLRNELQGRIVEDHRLAGAITPGLYSISPGSR
jgi:hypothetical protein